MKRRIVIALLMLPIAIPSFADITFSTESHKNAWGWWPFNYTRTETMTLKVTGATFQDSPYSAWFAGNVSLVFQGTVNGDNSDMGRMAEYDRRSTE